MKVDDLLLCATSLCHIALDTLAACWEEKLRFHLNVTRRESWPPGATAWSCNMSAANEKQKQRTEETDGNPGARLGWATVSISPKIGPVTRIEWGCTALHPEITLYRKEVRTDSR